MVCRRRSAWSTATFTDAILSSFIIPFGPVLLLSHFDPDTFHETDGEDAVDGLDGKTSHRASHDLMQWAAVARLWSQVQQACRARNAVGEKRLPFNFVVVLWIIGSSFLHRLNTLVVPI